MKFFIVILAAFISLLLPAHSKADALPQKMRGLWAVPDCGAPERYIYHSASYVLYITKDDAMLRPISVTGEGPNYQIISTGGFDYPALLHNDGILEIALLDRPDYFNITKTWEEHEFTQRREFLKCDIDVKPPHTVAPIALRLLDVLKQYCAPSSGQDCQKKIYAATDIDNDNRITLKELKILAKASLYLDIMGPNRVIQTKAIETLMTNATVMAENYAETLLKNFQTSDARDLDMSDIRDISLSSNIFGLGRPIVEAQKNLIKRFPGLKPPQPHEN